MEKMQGLVHDLLAAKMVNMITYSEDGSKRSRPMTNFNDDPYGKMWFPTYITTKKVKDIERNHRVIISFPSYMEGRFWEIEGGRGLRRMRRSRPIGGGATYTGTPRPKKTAGG